MSMRHYDPLLRDVMSEGLSVEAESASLAGLLSANWRVHRQRRILRTAAACALVLLGVGLSSVYLRPHPQAAFTNASTPATAPRSAPLRELTDEELFALFPDRQMALIGPPGEQRLVFLDR